MTWPSLTRGLSVRTPVSGALQGWRPDAVAIAGLAVVSAFVLPARLVMHGLGAAGRPSLLAGLILLAWWGLATLCPGQYVKGRNPLRTTAYLFCIAYLTSYLLGLFGALPLSLVSAADRSLLKFAGLVGFALAISDGCRTRGRLDDFLKVMLLGGTFMGVVGTLQFVFSFDLTPHIRVPGLVANGDLIGLSQRGSGFNRVAGTAGHYIEFGVLMALTAPLALHFALFEKHRLRRVLFFIDASFLSVCSLYSISRSAVVALVLVVLFSLPAWSPRRIFNLSLIGTALVAGVQVMQPGLLGSIRSLFRNLGSDPSIQGRTGDYAAITPLAARNLWFGGGPGNGTQRLLDNEWLNFLLSNGVVGLFTILLLLGTAAVLAKRVGRWAEFESDRHLGHILGASMLSIMFISLTFDSLSFSTFAVATFCYAGACAALWRLSDRPAPTADRWLIATPRSRA